MSRRRTLRSLALALIVPGLLVAGSPGAFAAHPRASAAGRAARSTAAGVPSVRLMTPTGTIKVPRFPGQPVYVDPGMYVASVGGTFQVNVWRSDYDHAPQAAQIISGPGTPSARPLPTGLVRSLNGLNNFYHVVIRDKKGHLVSQQSLPFCPSGSDQRTNSSGPPNPTFPRNCLSGPFALGSVLGIDRGWAVSALGYGGVTFNGKNGDYTLRVSIAKPYREFFGIPDAQAVGVVRLQVRKDSVTCQPFCPPGNRAPSGGSASRGLTAAPTTSAPDPNTLPDLIALPAWNAVVTTTTGHDYLEFAATIWNRGPSPLVVEGFRAQGQPKMNAWQYFYDTHGSVVGRARVGALHYDVRAGHEHWHFEQFARYSLLDSSKRPVVLSQKEAFCLAPTDALDMTTPGAVWNPGSTGVATACGGPSAIWVREVLPTGWGDTYVQSLPGQSLDITTLPNGTYFLSVVANPDRVLYERDTSNNTELREIRLSGTPGARSVTMQPWHGISA